MGGGDGGWDDGDGRRRRRRGGEGEDDENGQVSTYIQHMIGSTQPTWVEMICLYFTGSKVGL